MYENEKLMIGEHFTYKSIEWICLDVIVYENPKEAVKIVVHAAKNFGLKVR